MVALGLRKLNKLNSMELNQLIYKLYQDIANQICPVESDKLKVICELHEDDHSGGFSISLEIVVVERLNDFDDYGIVLSTNAQKNSHYKLDSRRFEEGLYLVTDLSFGDGEIVDEINEVNYLPFSEESNREIWEVVREFALSKIELVKEILSDKYKIYI